MFHFVFGFFGGGGEEYKEPFFFFSRKLSITHGNDFIFVNRNEA